MGLWSLVLGLWLWVWQGLRPKTKDLKCRQILFPVRAFNCRLAGSVVACGGNGLEPALVNRLTATRTDSVSPFLDTQECLINVRHDLRAALAEP